MDPLSFISSQVSSASLPSVDQNRLEETATEFESLFVKQMLDSMRSTLDPSSELLYGGFAQDIFEDMLYTEYARMLAQQQNFGVAEAIITQYAQSIAKSE